MLESGAGMQVLPSKGAALPQASGGTQMSSCGMNHTRVWPHPSSLETACMLVLALLRTTLPCLTQAWPHAPPPDSLHAGVCSVENHHILEHTSSAEAAGVPERYTS